MNPIVIGAARKRGSPTTRSDMIVLRPAGKRKRRVQNARTGGFLGLENKFVDNELDATAFAATWATMEPAASVETISATAIGNTESSRDGRVYFINSVHLRGFVSRAAVESQAAPFNDVVARICLVWDTQTNGAQLTATDVMDGGQSNDYIAFRNLQFTKRFRILMDKTITLKAYGQTNEGAVNLFANGLDRSPTFVYNRVFKTPIKVICKGTTAVVASITDNSLHVIGAATGASALLTYQSRIRFSG